MDDRTKSIDVCGKIDSSNVKPLTAYFCSVPAPLVALVAIDVLNTTGSEEILGTEKLKVCSKSMSKSSPYHRCPPPTREYKSFS